MVHKKILLLATFATFVKIEFYPMLQRHFLKNTEKRHPEISSQKTYILCLHTDQVLEKSNGI